MKERLIELLDKTMSEQYEKRQLVTAKHTAEYLLANGVIVPPCNVGDMVYPVGIFTGQIVESRVGAITKSIDDITLHLENQVWISVKQHLGKTVFLTPEEAEKALAERSEGK